jgi:hypothetical protein
VGKIDSRGVSTILASSAADFIGHPVAEQPSPATMNPQKHNKHDKRMVVPWRFVEPNSGKSVTPPLLSVQGNRGGIHRSGVAV